MKKATVIILLLALCLLACSCQPNETVDVSADREDISDEFVSLQSMVRKSDFVLLGKVILTGEMVFEGESECVTNNRVEIERIYKGDDQREYIDFIINSSFRKDILENGSAVYHLSPIEDEIVPEQGKSYIFFLKKTENGKYRPLDINRGIFEERKGFLTSVRDKSQFVLENALLQLETGDDFTSMDYYKSAYIKLSAQKIPKELTKREKNSLRAELQLKKAKCLHELDRYSRIAESAMNRLAERGMESDELMKLAETVQRDIISCREFTAEETEFLLKEQKKLQKIQDRGKNIGDSFGDTVLESEKTLRNIVENN